MEDNKRPMTRVERNMEWHGKHIPYDVPRKVTNTNEDNKRREKRMAN